MKDTLKISGGLIFPSKPEIAITAQPDGLIKDVVVVGVSSDRASDEKVPRAWIVLNQDRKKKSAVTTFEAPEEWVRSLMRRKRLGGKFGVRR